MSKASNLAGFASSISSNNNLNVGIVTASGFVGNLTGNATGLSGSPNVVLGITTVSAGSTSAPAITPSGDNNTGVFFPSADTIAFAEGGVEAARFDSSGRLLVGTSTARENTWNSTLSQSVQIEGTTSTGRSLGIFSSAASSDASYIVLAHQRSGSIGGNTVLQNNDDVGLISFQGSDGSEFVEAARIRAEVDGTPGANDMPGRLVFSTTADGARRGPIPESRSPWKGPVGRHERRSHGPPGRVCRG